MHLYENRSPIFTFSIIPYFKNVTWGKAGRDVFELRSRLAENYASYFRRFFQVQDERVKNDVEENLSAGLLWSDPSIQLAFAF